MVYYAGVVHVYSYSANYDSFLEAVKSVISDNFASFGDNYDIIDLVPHGQDWLSFELAYKKDETIEQIVKKDAKTKTKQSMKVNDHVIGSVFIYIHEKSKHFIFAPTKFNRSVQDIIILLNKKLFGSNPMVLNAKADLISDKKEFRTQIQKLKFIYNVDVKVVLPNPRSGKQWAQVEKDMRDNNVAEKRITEKVVLGKDMGLSEDINTHIVMAEDGYGEATVKGFADEDKKQKTIVSTKKIPIAYMPKTETINFEEVGKFYVSLMKRFEE